MAGALKKVTSKADRMILLMEKLAAGSQRTFAGMLGCSQAAISKIVTGKQEPGRHLLRLAAELPGVNAKWLLDGVGEPFLMGGEQSSGTVRLARKLVPGDLRKFLGSLSGSAINVPAIYATATVYGILAGQCADANELGKWMIRGDDVFLVETDITAWVSDTSTLDGRFVVVQSDGAAHLAHVTVDCDRIVADWPEIDAPRLKEVHENPSARRRIDLPDDSVTITVPATSGDESTIPIGSVVGLVLQLVRLL